MTCLTAGKIESILEPVFSSSVKLLNLRINLDVKKLDYTDLLVALKRYDARKIFRITTNLLDRRGITEKIMEKELEEISAEEIYTAINSFIKEGLFLRIEPLNMRLQLSPSHKLLITPLGIIFFYCYRKGLFNLADNLVDTILYSKQFLGSLYNDLVINNVKESLHKRETALSRKEIALSLLLSLSQAVTYERALKISKIEREKNLTYIMEALNRISELVFNDPKLFPDTQETLNAIQRSTGASGLEGKMLGHFVKSSSKQEDILYFNYDNEQELSSIIARICKSIKKVSNKDNTPYEENLTTLIDKYIRNRNLLFSPWIRRKFLTHKAETLYLQKLMGLYNLAS